MKVPAPRNGHSRSLGVVAAVLLLAGGCGGGGSGETPIPLPPPPELDARDRLTVAELRGTVAPGVVHNDYYQPRGDLVNPPNPLCGVLHFTETRMDTTHVDADWRGGGHTLFPAFDLPVVVHGSHLIPLNREMILSGHGAGPGNSVWNVIVDPGEAWEEAGDDGHSRAAFPFTLTDNYVGHARNGLATFVFDATGPSSVAVQITQETAPVSEHDRVNFSALVPVEWDSDCPAATDLRIAEFEQELARRLPLRPWSVLPNAVTTRSRMRAGHADTDFSMAALLMDGELYVQTVATRSGPHPWPERMRHGVYSVTKTMALGVSMFYLAARYGDGVFDELITDHVPELFDHPGWQGVTFHHTLNMVTGTLGAESGSRIGPYIMARSSIEKINAIAELPDAAPAPGTEFAYFSTHSFVLSLAMNNLVRAREGGDANYWDMVRRDVLEPIGVSYLPISRTTEPDGRPGIPLMGWGAYPDVDAAAKIARLLQDDGLHDGRQLLSRFRTREAMRRESTSPYPTGHPAERYLHSVWTVRTDTGACIIDVPLMSGYGGNHVIMLPSGLIVIRFMDAEDYEVAPSVRAVQDYRSSC